MESDIKTSKKRIDEPSKCPFPDKPWYACIEYCENQCIAIDASDKVSSRISKMKASPDVFNGWNIP